MISTLFLYPLVSELEKFWVGVELIDTNGLAKEVRCPLLCVACDLTAARKTCGFLSYVVHFDDPGGFECLDYSGFDRQSWQPRDGKDHQKVGSKHANVFLTC